MQHIGLQRESETGVVLADFGPNGIDVRVVLEAPKDSVCLQFIDPYGNTTFNQLQLPVLIAEVLKMRESSTDPALRDNLSNVVAFLEASEDIHTYVRFVGD